MVIDWIGCVCMELRRCAVSGDRTILNENTQKLLEFSLMFGATMTQLRSADSVGFSLL